MSNLVTITSGKYRGRKLITPGGSTHPMGSREKLALFNMLQGSLPDGFTGIRVLDAFAGTGALGLEALSRGATEVTFIECNPAALRCLRQNCTLLDRNDQLSVTIFPGKVANFASEGLYDLILVDPPYDHFRASDVEFLASFLAPDGLLALSHPDVPLDFPSLKPLKTKQYARANITLFRL